MALLRMNLTKRKTKCYLDLAYVEMALPHRSRKWKRLEVRETTIGLGQKFINESFMGFMLVDAMDTHGKMTNIISQKKLTLCKKIF